MPRKRALEPSELIDALRANMQLLAELSVRYEVGTKTATQNNSRVIISSPADVHAVLRDEMADLAQEQLRVLLLDRKNHLVGRRVIYQGTVSECRVRPAEVVRPAVVDGLPNVIVVHNHPSGRSRRRAPTTSGPRGNSTTPAGCWASTSSTTSSSGAITSRASRTSATSATEA